MVTLRRLLIGSGFAALILIAAVFAYSNPGRIDVDVGFAKVEQLPIALAFATVFAVGWVVGLMTAGVALLRGAAERRHLRRDLQYAEAELATLRRTALPDAN